MPIQDLETGSVGSHARGLTASGGHPEPWLNVSCPVRPVRKFEPVPPCTAIASSPLPEWMNQLSVLTPTFRWPLVMPNILMLQIADRASVGLW